MAQYRSKFKCIYCQKSLSKRNRSVEHVLPKCILQKGVDALTLTKRVCRTCNSSFDFEIFFSELTRVALMNQQVKHDLDGIAVPAGFFAEDFSKCTVNKKEYLRPYKHSAQIDQALNERVYYNFSFDREAEEELMRGMAKVGLNALLVEPPNPSRDFRIEEHEKVNFSGHEDDFAPLRKYITGEIPNNGFVREIKNLNDPCLVAIGNNGVVKSNRISPNEVLQTMHMVDIHRYEDTYFCFVTLFLGLENSGAIYSVSLNRDLSEYSVEHMRGQASTYVRTVHFYYHLSDNSVIKKRRLETRIIQPVKIEPVDDSILIWWVNRMKN